MLFKANDLWMFKTQQISTMERYATTSLVKGYLTPSVYCVCGRVTSVLDLSLCPQICEIKEEKHHFLLSMTATVIHTASGT
jgi:hypothetical protein